MNMNKYLENADIETASDDYATRFAGDVGSYFLKIQIDKVLKIVKRYNSPSILDVGGGHAQLAIPLIKSGFNVTVTGSDGSCEQQLKREFDAGEYAYQTCDMLQLPYEDNSFDLVLAFRLIPHVDRWQQLIGELSRVAKRAIIVDYPDIRSSNILNALFFRLKKSMEGNTRPFGLFSRNQIRSQFEKYQCSAVQFDPEFFLPMVVHRKIGSAAFSEISEKVCRKTGLTKIFGSPVIVHAQKRG